MSRAAPKCTTVGVLKVAIPSCDVWERPPAPSVITTNINPVSAAADEPVMT
jgi:hypothetical protein